MKLPAYTMAYTMKRFKGIEAKMRNSILTISSNFDRSGLILSTDPSLSAQTDPTIKSARNFGHFEIRTRKFSQNTLKPFQKNKS